MNDIIEKFIVLLMTDIRGFRDHNIAVMIPDQTSYKTIKIYNYINGYIFASLRIPRYSFEISSTISPTGEDDGAEYREMMSRKLLYDREYFSRMVSMFTSSGAIQTKYQNVYQKIMGRIISTLLEIKSLNIGVEEIERYVKAIFLKAESFELRYINGDIVDIVLESRSISRVRLNENRKQVSLPILFMDLVEGLTLPYDNSGRKEICDITYFLSRGTLST